MRSMLLKFTVFIMVGGAVGGLFGYVRSCVEGG
jgi:hypothetical protein